MVRVYFHLITIVGVRSMSGTPGEYSRWLLEGRRLVPLLPRPAHHVPFREPLINKSMIATKVTKVVVSNPTEAEVAVGAVDNQSKQGLTAQ